MESLISEEEQDDFIVERADAWLNLIFFYKYIV